MKKALFIVGAVVILVFVVLIALRMYTKSHSPYEEVSHNDMLTVKYCRPYKKERVIFGGLVPYNQVWRTGANEATIFETTTDIIFGGVPLSEGEYTLWTIPTETSWQVIINSQVGQWGVDMNGVANRNEKYDVFSVEAGVINSEKTFEQFTIFFEEIHDELELVLVWDQTMVIVPISISE